MVKVEFTLQSVVGTTMLCGLFYKLYLCIEAKKSDCCGKGDADLFSEKLTFVATGADAVGVNIQTTTK